MNPCISCHHTPFTPKGGFSQRDAIGEEHYKFCRNEYDIARHYLKNCGKPKDWYESFLIQFYKETCNIFKKYK